MEKKIIVMDTTLRDGEQSPGCSMNLSEKLEMAAQLERLGVDVIEAGFAASSPGDFASVREVSKLVKGASVQSLCRSIKGDIEASAEALKPAESPILHVFLATSPVHMEYKLKMSPERVYETAVESIRYAKSFCSKVEFSAEDASRSDREFLVRVFSGVIAAGATTINIPDTVGYASPDEMRSLVAYLMERVSGIEKVNVSVHCHNDLGLAVANSLSSIQGGANQVECTINGIGERAGNASLEEVVMNLKTRSDLYRASTGIHTTQIYRSSQMLSSITGVPISPTKPMVGTNVFAHEAGIHQHGIMMNKETYEIMSPEDIGLPSGQMVLGKHSGKHAFADKLTSMGYHFSKDEVEHYFSEFKVLADKKKTISDNDIQALISHKKVDAPKGRYELDRFVINSGNTITATANLRLRCGGETIEKVAIGDGPIDASFKAINEICGEEFQLEAFSLNSLSEGEDALGETVVKISRDGQMLSGRGLSTDVVESSILSYVSAINRLYMQENEKP